MIYISRLTMRQAINQDCVCEGPAGPQWCEISSENVQFCAATRFCFSTAAASEACPPRMLFQERQEASAPAARRSPESFPVPLADPRTPSVVSKRDEPALAHKCVNLCAKRRRFRRPKIIVDHDPATIVKQVTVTVQIQVTLLSASKINRLNRAAALSTHELPK
jgi:hypothetical protein